MYTWMYYVYRLTYGTNKLTFPADDVPLSWLLVATTLWIGAEVLHSVLVPRWHCHIYEDQTSIGTAFCTMHDHPLA